MIRKTFKIIISAISIIGILVLLSSFLLTSNVKPVYANSNENIEISIKGGRVGMESGQAVPDSENNLGFYIVASGVPSSDTPIIVHFRTRDITAIARNGDYESINTTCTINSNTPVESDGTIRVRYAIKVNARNNSINIDGIYRINQFMIEIFKIEGGATINSQKSNLLCATATSQTFDTIKSGSYSHFADYEHLFEYSIPKLTVAKKSVTYSFKLYNGYDSIYYEKYIKSLLARPYVSAHGYIDEEFWAWTNTQFRILSDGKELFYFSFDGSFDDTRFALGDYKSDDDIEVHDFYTSSIKYPYLPSEYGKIKEMWLAQKDYDNLIDELAIKVTTNSDERYYKKWEVGMILHDDKKPEVVSAYVDQTANLTKNDKFYIQVKFSEPVQVSNPELLKLTAFINLGQTPVQFSYFTGSGTDTLCFATNLSDLTFNGPINSFTINKLEYSTYIKDFSFVNNSLDDYSQDYSFPYASRLFCSIDTRTPLIDDVTVSSNIQKSVTVSVRTDNIENGTLYYSWSKSNNTPTVYDSIVGNVGTQRTSINGENYNGIYYLHLKLLSKFGHEMIKCFGPYKFDNTAPVTNVVYDEFSTLKVKNFTIICSDGPTECSSGIDKLYMSIKDYSTSVIATDENNQFVLTAETAGFGEGEYGTRQIAFYSIDTLENCVDLDNLDYNTYRFDTRDIFASKIESLGVESIFNANMQTAVCLQENADVSFKITNLESHDKLVFEYLVNYDNQAIDESAFEITFSENNDDLSSTDDKYAILKLKTPIAGAYKICLKTFPGNKIAEYYIVVGYGKDNTKNYENINQNRTLINKVYQLSTAYSSMYYLDENGNLCTLNYGGGQNVASFSSKEKAFDYALFREYEDIYAIEIDDRQATWLNAGNVGGYSKAAGETKNAESGQIWIRYKMKSWTNASTTNAWQYYYYGNITGETSIKTALFSANLQEAMQNVANTICESGNYNYLIEDNGVPKLDLSQLHFNEESFIVSKCNSIYESQIIWSGDENIYSSFVDLSGHSYHICVDSKITLNDYSKLYYKTQISNYIEIPTKFNDSNLKSIITSSGVYKFLEIDKNGINEFEIYIDCSAPILNFVTTSIEGGVKSFYLDEASEGKVFYGASASLQQIASEVDGYSYVAVYKYYRASSNVLLNVYRQEDFATNSITLENGEFVVKVGDRSGNCYSFLVFVNSEDLQVECSQISSTYIVISCNRESDQIDFYEIYLNGKMISNTYENISRFSEGGFYRIYIKDIYGSVYDETFEFTREYPVVAWRYLSGDNYILYDESVVESEIVPMSIEQISNTRYQIITSTNLRFNLPENYDFSFEGVAPNYSYNSVTRNVVFNGVNGPESFVLKVYYTNHSDIYVIYNVSIDTEAPTINVSLNTKSYNLSFVDELMEKSQYYEVGTILVPSSIDYEFENDSIYAVDNNQIVSSDLVYLNFADNSGINSAEIYIDGVLYTTLKKISKTVVSKYGDYRIVATDVYANKSEFVFTNKRMNDVTYYVDGIVQTSKDGLKIEYGNESVEYRFNIDCNSYFMLNYNGEKHFFVLNISKSSISLMQIIVVESEGQKGFALETLEGTTYTFNDYNAYDYPIIEGVSTIVKQNLDGSISFVINSLQDKNQELLIETCIQKDKKVEPRHFKTSLSQKASNITIIDKENKPICLDDGLVKINGNFKLSSEFEPQIVDICVQYSLVGDFDKFENIYELDKVYEDEGSYRITIRNVYGIETVYEIILSNNFVVVGLIEHLDGTTIEAVDFETLYSNSKISFTAYCDNAIFNVKRNGEVYVVSPTNKNDVTTIVINQEGSYSITALDNYGNTISFNAEIRAIELEFAESLLYGFNTKALLKNHTNQKISVSNEVLNYYDYLAIGFGDEINVLYDEFMGIQCEMSRLIDCIGQCGNGEYIVILKDNYGNRCEERVNYQDVPTLSVSRTLRSSLAVQECLIDSVLEIGAWANNSLIFENNSKMYIFKIDGIETSCPVTLAYNANNYDLSFVYKIYYLDEFGFEFEFDAHLLRKSVSIVPNNMTTQIVNGIMTTQDYVSVMVPDNIITTCSIDNGESFIYDSSQKLGLDGVYRFTATDYAGNTAIYTVKRDTIVECQFEEPKANKILLNGGVASTNRVVFRALNGDSAILSKVYCDKKKVNFTGTVFEDAGFWQVIAIDAVGNQKYFEFYILSHEVSRFAYTTPYEYKVSEVWYTTPFGSVISYMSFVNQHESTSDFDFFEDGKYTVVMQSLTTSDVDEFTFTLDTNPPNIVLVGCKNGEVTKKDITIKGCKVGDTVYVYRNGVLNEKVLVTSNETPMPVMSEGGDYTVVVESVSGVESEVSFTRRHILNTAGSVLIVILVLVGTFVMMFGLALRNREKTDI